MPPSVNDAPLAEQFRRFGADEWDPLRTQFQADTKSTISSAARPEEEE